MSSDNADGGSIEFDGANFDGVEYLLFDSLVHHLIEKGLLTKNDALSVVQTVAQVVRGQRHESDSGGAKIDAAMATLERSYSSFQALRDRKGKPGLDASNVHPLRPPLHGDRPRFPPNDD